VLKLFRKSPKNELEISFLLKILVAIDFLKEQILGSEISEIIVQTFNRKSTFFVKHFQPGDIIVTQGQQATMYCLILSGSVLGLTRPSDSTSFASP